MTHYVCPICGGTSDVPKTCETDSCSLNGEALHECNCEDGQHKEVRSEQTA